MGSIHLKCGLNARPGSPRRRISGSLRHCKWVIIQDINVLTPTPLAYIVRVPHGLGTGAAQDPTANRHVIVERGNRAPYSNLDWNRLFAFLALFSVWLQVCQHFRPYTSVSVSPSVDKMVVGLQLFFVSVLAYLTGFPAVRAEINASTRKEAQTAEMVPPITAEDSPQGGRRQLVPATVLIPLQPTLKQKAIFSGAGLAAGVLLTLALTTIQVGHTAG